MMDDVFNKPSVKHNNKQNCKAKNIKKKKNISTKIENKMESNKRRLKL